jgi:hypothetical protein
MNMDYNGILSEIKTLFIQKLETIVPLEAYEANPLLGKEVYLDTVYTDIMSLGYNYNDIEKATGDIYELYSALHGKSIESYEYIKLRVIETASLYPELIVLFSKFHRDTQAGVDFEVVLNDVKTLINRL